MCKFSVTKYFSVALSLTTVNIHQFLPQPRHLQEASQQEHFFCAGSGRRRAVVSIYPELCLFCMLNMQAADLWFFSLPLSSSLVELTEDILKQLMDLVFTLVCNGELSLARVLRKNILDKVEQKKLLRYTNSLKPLAARGVSARYDCDRVTHSDCIYLSAAENTLYLKVG